MTNYEKALKLKELDDFLIRSCWNCNDSHEHLKHVAGLFHCFDCGGWYMNGGFFNNEEHCNKMFIQLPQQEFIKIQLLKTLTQN